MAENDSTHASGEGAPRRARGWVLAAIGAAVSVGILVAVWFVMRPPAQVVDPPLLRADAKELKRTLVTPHLEAPIEPGSNVLWCSTFQLVWNESCRYAGGDIHLQYEPAMVPILNKKAASQKDVDAASCLLISGIVQDGVVGKIRRELDRKFPGAAVPDLLDRVESRLPPDGFLAYAYLFRGLPFKYPFTRFKKPLEFAAAKVASFGLSQRGLWDEERMAAQVAILSYNSDDDFIVELRPEDKSERIVLAKLAPAETLNKTIECVRARAGASDPNQRERLLLLNESIVVPILDFDLLREYGDLCHNPITTAGPLKGMPIVLAMQTIRFRLDERGAILKSEARAPIASKDRKPRQLIFDKPFLILLERRNASQPYFALWVDNAEILVPFR